MHGGPAPADACGPDWIEADDAFEEVRAQLADYFAGRRTSFDVPLDAGRARRSRVEVWRGLLEIGYGETISYGELARRIGRPRAVRAVGLANGRNPIAVIVPCHRVIGADGTLTGLRRRAGAQAAAAGPRGPAARPRDVLRATASSAT